ncbi:uncharacterized protein IL334_006776 [Kwoniella shivajii]|uniref:C2H2-type domain-containing protein n=1 Tax=Kwoniella shivajii TaxID=564305 RepID=A0ABZ1D8V4_9TREE|nr:hypothetical protein IL334_006776 [Kwoniella shivajii]
MVATKSPPTKSPISNKMRSPKSPRSPRSGVLINESFTPLSSILTQEPISIDAKSPDHHDKSPPSPRSPPKALALRRVLSGGSTTSTINTPKNGTISIPLSPSSGGMRTPKARKESLSHDVEATRIGVGAGAGVGTGMDIDTSENALGHGNHSRNGVGREGHQLATHLDGLQVNSPINGNSSGLPQSALGITQLQGNPSQLNAQNLPPPPHPQPQPQQIHNPSSNPNRNSSNGVGNGTTHDRSYSTSTEGSTSSIHLIPSHLGSSYGPEGFPVYSKSPESSPNLFGSQQSNGNGYHSTYNAGFGGANANGTGIDPVLAAQQAEILAKADDAVRALNGTAQLYQGNFNNSAVPTFEPYTLQSRNYANFVTPQQPNVVRQSSTSSSTTDAASTSSEESDWCIPTIEWVHTNPPGHLNSPGGTFAQRERDRASSRMPPPSTTNRPTSPRTTDSTPQHPPPLHHQQSLPVGASAATPSGLRQSSALPIGVPPDVAAEDDDDEATVGHNRERSPSTSSQSAQSGLDLLWRAAQGIPKPHVNVYDPAFEHKGKRKAGAEAVDKWRSSGIPTGVSAVPITIDKNGESKVKSESDGPARKRRRSELALEPIDASGERDGSMKREISEEAVEEEQSEYRSPSLSSEPITEDDQSEYGNGYNNSTTKRGRPSNRGNRAIATNKRASNAPNAIRGGKPGSNINPANAPGGVTKGGTIKKVRKVGDSPPGGNRGGRRSSAGAAAFAGGVQCDYVNPLPPYNRCTDVFTRKYDLPRHMARHARREGELVIDGKLSEEKAVLWRTIKDKPKVTCNDCGENFTRMDALKRHQAKQHHG